MVGSGDLLLFLWFTPDDGLVAVLVDDAEFAFWVGEELAECGVDCVV